MKVLVAGTGGGLAASGISTMADQLVRTLGQMGHDATRVVVGSRHRSRPNRISLENLVSAVGDTFVLARAVRRTKPDLVWVHTFGVPTLPALRLLAQVVAVRAAGRRVTAHLHAFALRDQVRRGGPVLRGLLRLISSLSQHVVVLQDEDAEILRHTIGSSNIAVIRNWVDVPEVLPTRVPAPPASVVFVGTLTARKGVGALIDAVRLLGDVDLHLRIIGGPGDDGVGVARDIQERAADLVAKGIVTFLGQMPPPQVRSELESAHLLVLPSRAEGMPVAVLEALAEGCPVLVGEVGPLTQTIRQSGSGWVLSDLRPCGIAADLRQILQAPELLMSAGAKGHRLAADHYGTAAATARLKALLH